MTSAVLEVGPVTVRGPGDVPADLAVIAVAGIDDEITLVEDEPVAVSELWAEVLDAAAAGARALTLVCPTWWSAVRCDRVRAAARGADVVVMDRAEALTASLAGVPWAVVEIADELVMVSGAHAAGVAMVRDVQMDEDPDALVRNVFAVAGPSAEVVVDAPGDVPGALALGNAVVTALHRRGVAAAVADPQRWREPLGAPAARDDERIAERVRHGGRATRTTICAAAALVAVLGGITVAAREAPADEQAMTVLVEGRVGLQIPAGWTVRRITAGPGSARVEVVSPFDPLAVIHLTQSGLGSGTVSDTVDRALREQPAGVFVDFDPSAVVADRPVVGYREVRPGREVHWAVFSDAAVRIAIGCQSAPEGGEAVRPACEAAIRSAHAIP